MAKRLFAITAPSIKDTGTIGYRFIVTAGYPDGAMPLSKFVGQLQLVERGKKEVDIFKLVRGEPGAVGPNGTMRWKLFVGAGNQCLFSGSVDESPEDDGLQDFLRNAHDSVLMMHRDIFDRFEAACKAAGVELGFHHCDRELSTS